MQGTQARRHAGTQGEEGSARVSLRASVPPCLRASFARNRGYSFTEVMFAVVVLGIGFIMIAAMFPVALSQSKSTADETVAATIARGAVGYLESIADDTPAPGAVPVRTSTMPPTDGAAPGAPAPVAPFIATDVSGVMTPANVGSWEAVRGSLILPDDPRFAFVPLYRRETGSQTAQVIVIAVQTRARSRYDNNDTATPGTAGHGNLQARPVEVTITKDAGGTGVHWIAFADSTVPGAIGAVADGAYVVIANDPGKGTSPAGTFNGQVYRLGLQATQVTGNVGELVPNTWTFQPGSEYRTDPGPDGVLGPPSTDDRDIGDDALAYIVGREKEGTGPTYTGPAQDVSVYSTFITVKP